ncbi:hypothetical protein NBO_2g0089 [Nosema bombycis CQ1]|uniref:Uncharacterized protein n=1 Tax=Nosema bombycis (strain CQ1 / CVCC 102059) TaxID=578461 RepID=R0MRR8_NOSB1|nr:hypothetical protein NBO_2g0089 [Nosema bombycis CQ1]|eukprot:EOB15598.1 hypothetical protein NBO_2g0089 [Nosema bombycis CQ1]
MSFVIFLLSIIKTSPEELSGDQSYPNIKFRSRRSILGQPKQSYENLNTDRSRDTEYIHSIFPDEKGPYYIYPPGVSPISYIKKRIPYPEPGITPRKGIRYPPDFIHNPFDHNHGYPPSVQHNPFDHNHGYPLETPDQDVNTKERTRPFVGGPDDGDNPRNKDLKSLYDRFVNPPVPTYENPSLSQDKGPTQIQAYKHEKPRIFQGRFEDIPFPYNKQVKPFKPSKDLPPIYILPVPTTEFPPSGHDPLHPYGYPPYGHDAKHPYGFHPENPEHSHPSYAPPYGHDPLYPHGYLPIGPEHNHGLPSKEIKPFYPYGYRPPDINPENIDNPFAYDHGNPPGKIYNPDDPDMNYPPGSFPQFFTRISSNDDGKYQKVDSKNFRSRGFVSQDRVELTFKVTKSKK